jgi:putative ABC transport system substrate-binding protein
MPLAYRIFVLLLCILGLAACQKEKPNTVTIGIVKPLEHAAMTEIVAGFSETLRLIYEKPVIIKVDNAQNDAHLERAIFEKMRDQKYDLIIPIGIDPTQMALSVAPKQAILSLASNLSEAERKQLKTCRIAVVHDEIPPLKLLQFIHAVYPKLSHLTLIHSTANKVLPQAKEIIKLGKENNIEIHPFMVSALPELYNAAHALPEKTEGIIVLKDHLIVSGIATLAQIAAKKHIPLITADQGSVKAGAGFALGVQERDIGEAGAKLAAALLRGQSPCDLPIVEMKSLTVFVNKASLEAEKQNLGKIALIANDFDYHVIATN